MLQVVQHALTGFDECDECDEHSCNMSSTTGLQARLGSAAWKPAGYIAFLSIQLHQRRSSSPARRRGKRGCLVSVSEFAVCVLGCSQRPSPLGALGAVYFL